MLLAGCSLFGGDKSDTDNGMTSTDPKERFEELSSANRNALADRALEEMGNMVAYTKRKTNLMISGSALIEMIGGNLNFSLKSSSEIDNSTPEMPIMKSDLDISANLDSPVSSGEGSASLSVMAKENILLASLQKFTLTIPDAPSDQITEKITPLLGKWYGGTPEELTQLLGNEFSTKILLGSSRSPGEVQQKIVEIIRNTKLFVFSGESNLGKEGLTSYEVTVDTNAFQEMIVQIMEATDASQESIENTKADMSSEFSGINITGIIGFSPSDPFTISFEGKIEAPENAEKNANITVFISENETQLRMESAKGEMGNVIVQKQEGKKTFTISEKNTGDEKEKTILNGTVTEDTFELSLLNPEEENTEVAHLSLKKSEGKWSGALTNEQEPDIVFLINEFSFTRESILLDFELKKGESVLTKANISYDTKEIDSVDVTLPSEYGPFSELVQSVLPTLFGGLSTNPALEEGLTEIPENVDSSLKSELPEGMTEEELNAMIEQAMSEQGTPSQPEETSEPDIPAEPKMPVIPEIPQAQE